jgi:hypothetical protein
MTYLIVRRGPVKDPGTPRGARKWPVGSRAVSIVLVGIVSKIRGDKQWGLRR